jgi:hypothetical protein
MASRAKKLSDLKEGDEAIFVCVRDSGEERTVAVIEKVNRNRIHCGAARFDRTTGLPVGSWLGDPSIQCRLQAAAKQEIRAVLREHNVEMARRREATLVDRLSDDLSVQNRKDIVALCTEGMKKQPGQATLQERLAKAIFSNGARGVVKRLSRLSVAAINEMGEVFIGPTVQERVADAICHSKPDDVLAKLGRMSVRTTYQLADAFGVKYERPKPRGVRRTETEQPPR